MYRGLMLLRWLAPTEGEPQGSQSLTGQGDGAPKYATVEEVNRAISARLGDFQKKIEKSIGESFAATLTSKLEELKSSLGTNAVDPSKEAPKGADIENHPLVKGLQKQLDEQLKSFATLKGALDTEKAQAREQTLRTKLAEDLTKGGVDPTRVRHAVGILVDVEKRVRFADEEGDELVFKDTTGDVDLATGVKSWLKSDDAKIFLPPRGTQGAGDRGQGKTQTGQQPPATSVGSALLNMARGVMGENPNG